MEEEGLTTQQSMRLLDEAKEKIENLRGNTEKEAKWCARLKTKFDSVVTKNPDIAVVRGMVQRAQSGEKISSTLALLKYCPVTSVDCERLFR